MTRLVLWLGTAYVALLPLGRSGLPMNAQWADLVLPLLAFAVARESRPSGWLRAEDWPLAFYLGVTFLAALVSPSPWTGLAQLVKQLSGVLVLVVFRQVGRDPAMVRALVRAFAAVFALVALASIVAVFLRFPPWLMALRLGVVETLPFLGAVRRLRGGFLTPEMLGNAILVAFTLTLALRALSVGRARRAWVALASVLFAGSLLTFSHSVAGFGVAAVFFLGREVSSRVVRGLAWSLALAGVLAVNAASVIEPGPRTNDHGVGPLAFQWMGVRVEGQLNHYAGLKQVAWSAFLEHPLTGVGPGQFATETERAFREGRFPARYRNKPAQCDFLGRLAESGILGGVSLLAVWASWLRRGTFLAPKALVSRAAFAALVGLLVNSLNGDVMNFRFLWLTVALMSASPLEGSGDHG